jgi:DNA-directed RNA polymerase subunit alpha
MQMSTRLNRFEMPKSVVMNEETATPTFAEFTAEPFEAGYGRTIGNSLRRVLLSSLEGAAIATVRIQGAEHEFCHLKGCVEDVTDIVLNLKKVLFKTYSRQPKFLRICMTGPCEVTAGDIEKDMGFDAEVEVKIGRGYCPAELNKHAEQEIGLIPIDSLFSPVVRVKYTVENTRVGKRTDYDKLTLGIWTDGRIGPTEALTTSAAILRHHLDVFVNFGKDVMNFASEEKASDPAQEELIKRLAVSVNEIELSVRAANCLNNANIMTVGELAQKSEAEMLKYRNFGKKSLNEIKAKLAELGLSLGMQFDPAVVQALNERKD